MTSEHQHHQAGTDRSHEGHPTQPGGLQVSEHGYTLTLDSTIITSGAPTVTFRVNGPDGRPVTKFEPTHDKELHFIAVRRDTSGFQHVHPVMDEAGTWTTALKLMPGDWRFYADFHPADHGEAMTLGIDASVGGQYDPQPLPEVSQTAQVGEYSVSLRGTLMPHKPSELTLTVSKHGRPVSNLQPYLAAYGHLVALRVGDLAYLHVHPEGEPGDGTTEPGPQIAFMAAAPSAGPYRLYLDFQHEGVVRTAEFTVHATDALTPRPDSESAFHTKG